MEWHPYAKLFPMLGAEALALLTADIEANGLKQPIIIDRDERIIDGRNRDAACRMAGVTPVYEPFTGSDAEILKLVVSLNIHRRHLTESQRAMIAAEVATIVHGSNQYKVESSIEDSTSRPVTQQQAADLLSVSKTSVERAAVVKKKGTPELADAVTSGQVTVTKAAEIAALPTAEQGPAMTEAIENPPRRHVRKPPAPEPDIEPEQRGKPQKGVGIDFAHKAIAQLRMIPTNDPLRARAYQIVSDYMKSNP